MELHQPWQLTKIVFKAKNGCLHYCITNSKYNSHTEPLFKSSKILPLTKLIDFFNVQFMHKFNNNLLPSSFANVWIRNQDRRQPEGNVVLRNQHEFFIPANRLTSTDRFPFTNLPRMWNNLPENIRNGTSNPLVFKRLIREHFLSELSVASLIVVFRRQNEIISL
jgi:hypothetical protein